MAEKILNTRIQLKYDTYENWIGKNPILKAGEVAIATVPSNQDGVQNAPSVLIKVGDGTSDYKTLKFVSGLAADVYSWAKAENKPEYEAKEITGIDAYIADYVNEQMGISVDTDTQYKMVKVSDTEYKLQSKGKTDSAWADVDCDHIVIPQTYDDTALAGRVSDVEAAVDTLNGTGTGSVAKAISDAIAALNLANTYAAKEHTHTKSEITDFAHNHEMSEVTGLVDALAGKQAAGDYATKAEAQAMADGKDAAISAAQTAANKAQGEVDALELVVEGKADKATTLAGYGITDAYTKGEVDAAIEASEYDDTEVRGLISDNADAAAAAQATADAAKATLDAFMKEADATETAVDTLKEIQAELAEGEANAASMLAAINKNKSDIETLNGTGAGSVDKKIADAIAAENLSQYATDTELAATNAEVAKKANDADLSAIAKTGNVNDLVQTTGDVLVFDCGNATF